MITLTIVVGISTNIATRGLVIAIVSCSTTATAATNTTSTTTTTAAAAGYIGPARSTLIAVPSSLQGSGERLVDQLTLTVAIGTSADLIISQVIARILIAPSGST